MPKEITLTPGQSRFVSTDKRYVGFVGGVGSGKTFTGLMRGIDFSMQPKAPGRASPRGAVLAIHYNELDDVVLPEFFEIVEGTGILKNYEKSKRKATLMNGAEILFRSLDNPNWRRGLQLSWFFIDEARNVSYEAWKVLIGRLRQPGYKHSGWLATTPNGFDWVYDLFHPEGERHQADRYEWVPASTMDNQANLPEGYIDDLMGNYEGNYLRQEVYGEFVGVAEGAVFSKWNLHKHLQPVAYDPALPLYSTWDFGVGDLQVVEYAQVEYVQKEVFQDAEGNTRSIFVPKLRFLDVIEGKDMGAKEWARIHKEWLATNIGPSAKTKANFGDPAGKQRSAGSATSVIQDLAAEGVTIYAAPKRPPDYGIRILNNMMEGDRVVADKDRCSRLGAAFSTFRWNVDARGNRIGNKPVHDWTSHYATAAYYLANSILDFNAKRHTKPKEQFPPGSAGDIQRQILAGGRRTGFGQRRTGRRIVWSGGRLG